MITLTVIPQQVLFLQDFLFVGVHWIIEIIILIFLALFLWVCIIVRAIRYFWKFPAPARIGNAIAAGPYRRRVQPPSMIIEALEAKPGMTFVEIGCGSGFYTIAVAKAIAPNGIVYAVDIQQGILDRLRARMDREGVENIIPVLADAEQEIPLEEEITDGVFSVTVIPEIQDPVEVIRKLKQFIKVNGIFADAELIMDPDYPLRRTMRKWCEAAGLVYERQLGNLIRYVMVFRKVD